MRASSLRRSRFLLLAAALVALAALFAPGAQPARAQQSTALVSNIGQTTTGGGWNTATYATAQAFTTGSESGGYTLDSIDAVLGATNITQAQRNSIRAELWSAATGGAPGSKLADLAVPDHPISTGTVSFAAPANTTLAAGTTYYAVMYTIGPFRMVVRATSSDSEDSGSAAGWSIANGGRNVQVDVPTSTSNWSNEGSTALKITVNGSVNGSDPKPTVSISASPTTVDEGSPVTITLTLSSALSSRVTIPLVIYDFSSEPGDYGRLASITIPANSITGTGIIATRHDADIRDDVFGVNLGTLPPEVVAGSPSSVAITIVDDDYPDTLSDLPSLPIDYSQQRPASERTPTGAGASASDAYCYIGAGNGTTEYIRYPDGRVAETTRADPVIRSMYACD